VGGGHQFVLAKGRHSPPPPPSSTCAPHWRKGWPLGGLLLGLDGTPPSRQGPLQRPPGPQRSVAVAARCWGQHLSLMNVTPQLKKRYRCLPILKTH